MKGWWEERRDALWLSHTMIELGNIILDLAGAYHGLRLIDLCEGYSYNRALVVASLEFGMEIEEIVETLHKNLGYEHDWQETYLGVPIFEGMIYQYVFEDEETE